MYNLNPANENSFDYIETIRQFIAWQRNRYKQMNEVILNVEQIIVK